MTSNFVSTNLDNVPSPTQEASEPLLDSYSDDEVIEPESPPITQDRNEGLQLSQDQPESFRSSQLEHPSEQDTSKGDASNSVSPAIPSPSQDGAEGRSSDHLPDWQDVRFGNIALLEPWFPEVNPEHETFRSRRSRRKAMLWTAFGSSATVLLANLVTLIVLMAKFKPNRGVVSMLEGDCSLVKRLDIVAHVFINILGTALLGASNLCMQLLAAPTRKEVNKAHGKGKWLDIGVPSIRNLSSIHRSRLIMWLVLGCSSIPVHFIYNSVMSASIPQYGYAAAVVSESFLTGAQFGANYTDNSNGLASIGQWNLAGKVPWPPRQEWNMSSALHSWQTVASDPTNFTNMSNTECLHLYTNVYARRTNLIIVTEDLPGDQNASVHQYVYLPAGFSTHSQWWPCQDSAPGTKLLCIPPNSNSSEQIKNWNKFNRTILYCLSEVPADGDHCRLNYSPSILIGE
jgi:hypothetical protein